MIETSVGFRRNADTDNMTSAFEMMYQGYACVILSLHSTERPHIVSASVDFAHLVVLPQTATTMTVVAVLLQAHEAVRARFGLRSKVV